MKYRLITTALLVVVLAILYVVFQPADSEIAPDAVQAGSPPETGSYSGLGK